MPALLLFRRLFTLLVVLLARQSVAQQPATRAIVISPIVGPVIDKQERITYNLFPNHSPKEFEEASFQQNLALDSAITLRTTLSDGRTLLRPIPLSEYFAIRQQIENQARTQTPTTQAAPIDSVGLIYRVTLRSGTTFAGTLKATRPQELEFTTNEPGAVIIARSQIVRMSLVPPVEAADALRHPTWGYVGNGTRVFFSPTARGLRAGEGYAQLISFFMLGANYGITDNFSIGILASALPGAGVSNQLLALTPKVSFPISPKVSVGAGVLYARIPNRNYDATTAIGAGVAYGLTTFGTADNNFTIGLGYGFSGSKAEARGSNKLPVAVMSGAVRVSKRFSLMAENYLVMSDTGALAGLYGTRLNWRRTTLGIGSFYYAPFKGSGIFGYVYPAYLDLALRFGKTAQK